MAGPLHSCHFRRSGICLHEQCQATVSRWLLESGISINAFNREMVSLAQLAGDPGFHHTCSPVSFPAFDPPTGVTCNLILCAVEFNWDTLKKKSFHHGIVGKSSLLLFYFWAGNDILGSSLLSFQHFIIHILNRQHSCKNFIVNTWMPANRFCSQRFTVLDLLHGCPSSHNLGHVSWYLSGISEASQHGLLAVWAVESDCLGCKPGIGFY